MKNEYPKHEKDKPCKSCGKVMSYLAWKDYILNSNEWEWNIKKYCDKECLEQEKLKRQKIRREQKRRELRNETNKRTN